MIIKSLTLPDERSESIAIRAGVTTLGMPQNYKSIIPFGVFPKRGIRHFDFGAVTVLAGSRASVKDMLVLLMSAKLELRYEVPHKINPACLSEYLKMACFTYESYADIKKYDYVYISKTKVQSFIDKKCAELNYDKKWSVKQYFEDNIGENSFVIIEDPESYMSFYELEEFAEYLHLAAHC